ncbi:MAG: hypothetical protein HN406_24695, partial [Lentisphaerae bacterium]|nr:hypothetical protein [Lentisphaerota bacterium]
RPVHSLNHSRTQLPEDPQFNGTKLKQFPIPAERPLLLARELDALAQELAEVTPTALIKRATPTAPVLADAQRRYEAVHGRMIALQEELDWQCYWLYGLVNDECRVHELRMSKEESGQNSPSGIRLGERAFEIVLARKLASGDSNTTWFARHGSTPIIELPTHWPAEYRELIERRIALIEADRNIRLIEQPEHKRRWAGDSWDQQVQQALQEWLLNRLEFALSGRDLLAECRDATSRPTTRKPILTSVARLADLVRGDTDFMQVAELYTARPDFDVTKLVLELVQAESVPESVLFRCKESGRRKREDWEQTWELQRQEDRTHDAILAHICPDGSGTVTLNQQAYQNYLAFATRSNRLRKGTTLDVWTAGNDVTLSAVHAPHLNCKTVAELADKIAWHLAGEKIGEIPVPPKYANNDFAKTSYYQLRGKLDVPKERFVLYPQAERAADPTPVITWAGWNHLQRMVAMSTYYEDVKVREDWSEKRRAIFLATMLELLPWVKQWHGGIDPEFGEDMGDYFHEYLEGEARAIEYSLADLKELEP